MLLKIKKLDPLATMPTYSSDGAACFDLYALAPHSAEGIDVVHSKPISFRTGLAFEVPEGHVMLVFSRSGYGFNHATRLANCVGVIDSDYRGELLVRLTRDLSGDAIKRVQHGDRIAQAMILPVPTVQFEWAEELSQTARDANGYGSTGG